eukprot:GHVH01001171.1.p1 GENE.GHVH01001171.1~~GHVH01001171.1.p1  ORF type:complete len:319 (-),score=45.22 GHVH01001171.1:743-1636(-)
MSAAGKHFERELRRISKSENLAQQKRDLDEDPGLQRIIVDMSVRMLLLGDHLWWHTSKSAFTTWRMACRCALDMLKSEYQAHVNIVYEKLKDLAAMNPPQEDHRKCHLLSMYSSWFLSSNEEKDVDQPDACLSCATFPIVENKENREDAAEWMGAAYVPCDIDVDDLHSISSLKDTIRSLRQLLLTSTIDSDLPPLLCLLPFASDDSAVQLLLMSVALLPPPSNTNCHDSGKYGGVSPWLLMMASHEKSFPLMFNGLVPTEVVHILGDGRSAVDKSSPLINRWFPSTLRQNDEEFVT